MRIWFGLILKGYWDGEEVECVCGVWWVVGGGGEVCGKRYEMILNLNSAVDRQKSLSETLKSVFCLGLLFTL